MRIMTRALGTLLAIGLMAGGAEAQQMVRPEPLDPASPVATHVAAFVQVLLAGDVDAALAWGREHAAPAYREGSMAEEIRTAMAAIAQGTYRFQNAMAGPRGDVLVPLEAAEGAERLIFIVEIDADAPHHIRGIRRPGLRTTTTPVNTP